MQLNDKAVPRVFLIFIINMGSLKSERIDSTDTTISLLRSRAIYTRKNKTRLK